MKAHSEQTFLAYGRISGCSQPEGRLRVRRSDAGRESNVGRALVGVDLVPCIFAFLCLAALVRRGSSARFRVVLRRSKMVQILPPLRREPLGHSHIPRVFSRPVTSWTLLKPF